MASKFQITKPGQSLNDIAQQNATSQNEFTNPSVSVATVSSPTAKPEQGIGGDGALKSILDSKKEKADKLEESNTANLDAAKAVVESLTTTTTDAGEQLSLYQELVNTPLSQLIDLTTIDLTSIFPLASFDFAAMGLPEPSSANKVLSDVIDLSSVDLSQAKLPKLRFGKLTDMCWTLSDLIAELNGELKETDLRTEILPVLDYSDPAFDGWVWPDTVDRSNVWLRDVVDLSSVDLTPVIPTATISQPESLMDVSEPVPTFVDVGQQFDELSRVSARMGEQGDLLGLASLYTLLNQTDCLGLATANTLVKENVVKALEFFQLPGYETGDLLPDNMIDVISNALTVLPDEWMYFTGTEQYHKDNLLKVNPWVWAMLKNDSTYGEIYHIVETFRKVQ